MQRYRSEYGFDPIRDKLLCRDLEQVLRVRPHSRLIVGLSARYRWSGVHLCKTIHQNAWFMYCIICIVLLIVFVYRKDYDCLCFMKLDSHFQYLSGTMSRACRGRCGYLVYSAPFVRWIAGSKTALAPSMVGCALEQVLHSQLSVALRRETQRQYPCCVGRAYEL